MSKDEERVDVKPSKMKKFTTWEIPEENFPHNGMPFEKIEFLLKYAILAPSTHNTQPWSFRIIDDVVELHADKTRSLSVIDPNNREMVISCGCALFHLNLAMRYFGYKAEEKILPDPQNPDFIASIKLNGKHKPTSEEKELFKAIQNRVTNRLPFDETKVEDSLLDYITDIAKKNKSWLHIIKEGEKKNALSDLISKGDKIQMKDKKFRKELVKWIRSSKSKSRDGIPAYGYGHSDLKSSLRTLVIRTFDVGNGEAAKDHQLAAGSPILVVLGTKTDEIKDWILAGKTLAHILLAASSQNLWASFFGQPVEVPELRPKVLEIIEKEGFAQIVLRMGHGDTTAHTFRRDVNDVLHKQGTS